MSAKRRIASGGAAVVLAAGLAAGLVTSFGSGAPAARRTHRPSGPVTTPSPTTEPPPTVAPSVSVPAGAVVETPPAAHDCSADVSDSLRSWLYSLPAGTPAHPVVVRFARSGCYEVDSALHLRNFRHFVFDGNGSTFKRTSPRTIIIPLRASDPPAYCGSDFVQPNIHQPYQQTIVPIVWWFEGGCDLVVEDMTIEGNLSGVGGGRDEQDSAIQLNGVQRAMVRDVTVSNIEGDFVTVSGLHEAPGGGGGYPSTDVTITGNHFDNSGRQGVTTEYVNRVSVDHNYLTHVAATVFDIESDTTSGTSSDISIHDNTIDGPTYAYLLAAYTGSSVSDLSFSHNLLENGAQMKIAFQLGQAGHDITIAQNTASGLAGWPFAAIRFLAPKGTPLPVSRVEVAANSVPVAPWGHDQVSGQPFVTADPAQVSDLVVRDNHLKLTYGNGVPHTFSKVLPLDTGSGAVATGSGNTSCGNIQASGKAPLDGSCTHLVPAVATQPAPPQLPAL